MKDDLGYQISGTTPQAARSFNTALGLLLCWRHGADAHIDQALGEAPDFVMAHVLRAYSYIAGRDAASARQARAVHARVSGLPANAREQGHIAAISAFLADDFDALSQALDGILRYFSRDVLALHMAHAVDYLTGDIERMVERVSAVYPAWSSGLPGWHAILAMHAFAQCESGRYGRAADLCLEALAAEPYDARAHHAMAHVHSMTGRVDEGVLWMRKRFEYWSGETLVVTHCWWHWALFHLARGDTEAAMTIYDKHVCGGNGGVADLIDASALLWRLHLLGVDAGERWRNLARAWDSRIGERYCSFNDVHAMLAFAGAQDTERVGRLELDLAGAQHSRTRHGETTRLIGLPACRAVAAYAGGNYRRTLEFLDAMPGHAWRIGGSHAQRDVLGLTRAAALRRLRRAGLEQAA